MKKILIALLALSSFSTFAQTFDKQTQYRDLLNKLKLSKDCKRALSKHYSSGNDLGLEIIKKNIEPLSKFVTPGTEHRDTSTGMIKINGYDFYHYTDHDLGTSLYPEMTNREQAETLIRQNGGYEVIFKYLKQKELSGCCGMDFPSGFYIAEDDYTSHHYGKWRLVLELAPKTQVFKTSLAGDPLPPLTWDMVAQDLSKKTKEVSSACSFEDIKPIVLEDSGVDIVSYAGGDGAWFVMLNSRSITKSRFEKKF